MSTRFQFITKQKDNDNFISMSIFWNSISKKNGLDEIQEISFQCETFNGCTYSAGEVFHNLNDRFQLTGQVKEDKDTICDQGVAGTPHEERDGLQARTGDCHGGRGHQAAPLHDRFPDGSKHASLQSPLCTGSRRDLRSPSERARAAGSQEEHPGA